MAISFKCRCGRHLEIDDKYAGQQAKCPLCGQLVDVPGERVPSGPPRPGPNDPPSAHVKAWIADRIEENPHRTRIILWLAAWQGFLLLSLFVASTTSWAAVTRWFFVQLPAAGAVAGCLYFLLKGEPQALAYLRYVAVGSGAVSWTYLFLSLEQMVSTQYRAGLMFVVSFVNVLVSAAIIVYFSPKLSPFPLVQSPENTGEAPDDLH